MMRYEFVTKIYPQIERKGSVYLALPTHFDQHFNVLLQRWEQKKRDQEGAKKMKSFADTNKGKKVRGTGKEESKELSRSQTAAPG